MYFRYSWAAEIEKWAPGLPTQQVQHDFLCPLIKLASFMYSIRAPPSTKYKPFHGARLFWCCGSCYCV